MKQFDSIFELYYSWYEDYAPVFLIGPNMTEEDFQVLCKSLLAEAGKLAVKQHSDIWIGWTEILQALTELLKGHGFVLAKMNRFECWGSNIIRKRQYEDIDEYKEGLKALGDSLDLIDAHNKKLEKELDEEVNEIYGDSMEENPPKIS